MKPVEIKKGVHWVGAVDWDKRDFHGYSTPRGTTYNAYLLTDERTVLVDTVKSEKFEEMLTRIKHLVDPSDIDVIVANHAEPDHSGSLAKMCALAPKAKVLATAKGIKALESYYDMPSAIEEVSTGDELDIGTDTLKFLSTPMVHWPDSMVTYLPQRKLLLSNDAFGQHIASYERFDREMPMDILLEEAAKYYANIVLPFSGPVRKALEAASSLEIDMIAPSHGVIWEGGIEKIMALYDRWSSAGTVKEALIVYDSMWGSTAMMAESIYEAFEDLGVAVKKKSLKQNHISDIMTDVLEAEFIAVGSPTLNRGVMPSVASFLSYMRGLGPSNKKALAFGSYGWSGESVSEIEKEFEALSFTLLPKKTALYKPRENLLDEIRTGLVGEINELEKKTA